MLQFLMWFGQSEEDGSMPLMHATAAADVKLGGLYVPKHKGLIGMLANDGFRGPPIEKTPEALGSRKSVTDMLWEKSEAACGSFFE
jgi:hypothetical protein